MRRPLGPATVSRPILSRRGGWLRLAVLSCAPLLLVTACEQETTLIDPTRKPPEGPGTVQKATLAVTVTVAGEDSALASLVDSPSGVLRDAEVSIERSGTPGSWQAAPTDAAGTVTFEGLLAGRYSLSVLRLLRSEEIARFDARDADVNAFGGGKLVTVSAPRTESALEAVAGRRGSLVISELHMPLARLASGQEYGREAQFMELFNNSDTTVYLDGKILSQSHPWGFRDSARFPCEAMRTWQADPRGVWVKFTVAFPGSGRDYPLRPGEAAIVAVDAIDHGEIHPALPDLRRAHFETDGSRDVDNPSVPNMVPVDPWGGGGIGFGFDWGLTDLVAVLAEPVELNSLLQSDIPGALSPRVWLIPGEKILDVFSASPTPEREAQQTFLSPQCPRYIHENFDRQHARIIDHTALNGMQRRVFTSLPDGRVILQRTKTSARDFIVSFPATPGRVP